MKPDFIRKKPFVLIKRSENVILQYPNAVAAYHQSSGWREHESSLVNFFLLSTTSKNHRKTSWYQFDICIYRFFDFARNRCPKVLITIMSSKKVGESCSNWDTRKESVLFGRYGNKKENFRKERLFKLQIHDHFLTSRLINVHFFIVSWEIADNDSSWSNPSSLRFW